MNKQEALAQANVAVESLSEENTSSFIIGTLQKDGSMNVRFHGDHDHTTIYVLEHMKHVIVDMLVSSKYRIAK